jgi:hypothetical protein
MKYLTFVVLFCLLGLFSCEHDDIIPKAPEVNLSDSSKSADSDHYSMMAELVYLIKDQGKNVKLVTEEEVISIATAENIDISLIGQQMAAEIDELKAMGFNDEMIAERMAENQLLAMGITRDKVGTPCYDSYIDNLKTTAAALTVCLGITIATGPAGLLGCATGALIGQVAALVKYETCLDNRYPNGG